MVFDAINSILALLLLIAAGYYMTGKPWFGEAGSSLVSKLTVQLFVPCYMFYNILTTSGSREELASLLVKVPIPVLIILGSFAIGCTAAKFFSISAERSGVFLNAVAFSNTVIVGFPVVEAIYGPKALPDAMIYYMGNTILFWSLGVYLLKSDKEKKTKLFSAAFLKKLLSPPIIGFLLGMAVVLLGLPLPKFLTQGLSIMKGATTPLAMIFIGSVIRTSGFRSMAPARDMICVVFLRFFVIPLFVLMACLWLPLSSVAKQVFFLLATMPAMTQLGIMAKESGSDYEFAAAAITVTTLLSMLAIPVYVSLVTALL